MPTREEDFIAEEEAQEATWAWAVQALQEPVRRVWEVLVVEVVEVGVHMALLEEASDFRASVPVVAGGSARLAAQEVFSSALLLMAVEGALI